MRPIGVISVFAQHRIEYSSQDGVFLGVRGWSYLQAALGNQPRRSSIIP
jgi:hypothetical protein